MKKEEKHEVVVFRSAKRGSEADLVTIVIPMRVPQPQLRPSALARHMQKLRAAKSSKKT